MFSLLIDSSAVGVHSVREGKHVGFHFRARAWAQAQVEAEIKMRKMRIE